MSYPTLYKRTKNGSIQQWSIELNGASFRTIEGLQGGALTTAHWTTCAGKRKGAANETTPEQQAQKEVEAKITKQKDRGYTENVQDVDSSAKKISPMLAHKYSDYKDDITEENIASQPKLDGIRCIGTDTGLFTRNGKPITAAPHIFEQVQRLLSFIGLPGAKIDGELYNHDLKADFNKITSLVRKQSPNEAELAQAKQLLQYHIYDLDVEGQSFRQRSALLRLAHSQLGRVVPDVRLVHTIFHTGVLVGEEQIPELDYCYGQWLQAGYEGQMVRLANSVYEHSRSKSLLKRKEFIDAEFKILDIEEGVGNRSGMMGRIKFEGFDSNARGSHEYFKELLANKDKYIGKMATVRYQNLTPDGKPRFPVMIDIRDYE